MQKLTLLALAAIAVAMSLAVLPALTESALAKKEEVTLCPSGNECQGASGEKNPNREEVCRAGSKGQTNANCP